MASPDPRPPVPAGPEGVRGAVEAARARLAQVPGLPLAEHAAAYDDVHRLLQGALAPLDER